MTFPADILGDPTLPRAQDFNILVGDSFLFPVSLVTAAGAAIDLTGLTGTGEVRDDFGGTLLATFSVTHNDEGGVVSIYLSPANAALIPWLGATPGCANSAPAGVFSIRLSDGTDARTIISGKAWLVHGAIL